MVKSNSAHIKYNSMILRTIMLSVGKTITFGHNGFFIVTCMLYYTIWYVSTLKYDTTNIIDTLILRCQCFGIHLVFHARQTGLLPAAWSPSYLRTCSCRYCLPKNSLALLVLILNISIFVEYLLFSCCHPFSGKAEEV